ncbi:hypothetical protein GFD22_10455 [Bifidobacterium avesanii]|uniref:Uncharacterized protein n=2 Tax=Bifidobacterium avesanii TaxID=1798157 RepID=A0A7K3TJS7_9BIFI|nr:DNA repair protein RecO C-terminal domain-containing protein [Bifidobacterium avesanii]NEG79378.1 hypothetical protein [Bifidobacterium avesanii]
MLDLPGDFGGSGAPRVPGVVGVAAAPVASTISDALPSSPSSAPSPLADAYFSVPAGGLMCAVDHTPESRRLQSGVLDQLRALVDGDWDVLDPAELDAQTRHIVEEWGAYYLERPIRSLRLLD